MPRDEGARLKRPSNLGNWGIHHPIKNWSQVVPNLLANYIMQTYEETLELYPNHKVNFKIGMRPDGKYCMLILIKKPKDK
jgi:hypothetical protein